MNKVIIMGRVAREIKLTYTASQIAVAAFPVAVDRITKAGEEKKADFPQVKVFGKQAENCEKFSGKGCRIAIEGRIQTGSYTNKDGATVYTTEVIAERVQFIDFASSRKDEPVQEGFAAIDEEIPF